MVFKDTETFKSLIEGAKLGNAKDQSFSQSSNHGIVITDKKPTVKDKDAREVYRLIVTEHIKAYYPPREVRQFTVFADAEGREFKGTGKELISKGFSEIEGRRTVKENVPSNIKEGDVITLSYRITAPGSASRTLPSYSMLADYDFGKCPVSKQIDRLLERGLISSTGDKYSIERKAYPLLRTLQGCGGLLDGKFISNLLINLDALETDNDKTRNEAKANIIKDLDGLILYWEKSIIERRAVETTVTCPVCGGALKDSSDHLYCDDCGFDAPLSLFGRQMSYDEMSVLFRLKTTPLINGFNGDYLGRLYMTPEGTVEYTTRSDYACPLCSDSLRVRKKDRAYVCRCGYVLQRTFKGHEFTKAEIRSLLTSLQLPNVPIKTDSGTKTITLVIDKGSNGTLKEL